MAYKWSRVLSKVLEWLDENEPATVQDIAQGAGVPVKSVHTVLRRYPGDFEKRLISKWPKIYEIKLRDF